MWITVVFQSCGMLNSSSVMRIGSSRRIYLRSPGVLVFFANLGYDVRVRMCLCVRVGLCVVEITVG
jgi:hypothetical protein